MEYTGAQREAIECIDDNLQIIACAGSGKTQVISARIVEMLGQGADPGSIVAFTFTEKAAGELKDRIDRLALAQLGTNVGLGDMYVGTIHGYCLNLLQSPPLYRYLKYNVLDDIGQRLLIDRYSSRSGLTSVPLQNGKGNLKRWKDSGLYQTVISIYSEGDLDEALVPDALHEAIAQYHALLHEQRYLDYTMIISEAVQELESNEAVREQVAEQLAYLVVDEYQDVNPLQERLIRSLYELGANVCVVGDDDQTIYQWRGSDVDNIITFAERYADVAQVRLNENFRSNAGVVESAREVIELNPERLEKKMESAEMQPFGYGDLLALTFEDPAEEAEWIVERIQALHGTQYEDRPDGEPRGLTWGDMAVLLRSVRRDAGPIVNALSEAGVPFVVKGMSGLFGTPEIEAMRAVFYYMADFEDRELGVLDREGLSEVLRDGQLGLSETQMAAGLDFLEKRKGLLARNRADALLYLQRLYLDFLEAVGVKEETIPTVNARTGEIALYNLGKFSQVISDYERINFKSDPKSIYEGFASFLLFQAPGYYPEGWEESGLAKLDAVEISTVHRAKGMQWPAVFVPCLRQNRFPSKRHGGRQWYHVLPEAAVGNPDRYKGTKEDERRLFYVAITRAERYLACSYAPIEENRQQRKVSQFLLELTNSMYVLTEEPPVVTLPPAMEPKPRYEETSLAVTFSELKYYFECPYSFKLRFLYGFDEPINRALGYGRSLHDALAEIHHESVRGNVPETGDVERLVEEHLHLPFASEDVWENSRKAAKASLARYLDRNRAHLHQSEMVEKGIELKLADGIVVNGRIDLIRKTDTDDWIVVDFKSSERAQAEEITRQQLQVYALGYEQLTGNRAKLIEIHNLDDGGVNRELVNEGLITKTQGKILDAGGKLRANELPRLGSWCGVCDKCGLAGICRSKAKLS